MFGEPERSKWLLPSHVLAFEVAGRQGAAVDSPRAERELMTLVATRKSYRRMNNPSSEATCFGMRSAFRVDRALYRLEGERNGPMTPGS